MARVSAAAAPTGEPRVRYRDLFAQREFSALWVADVLSRSGSQIGQLAIAALVFERTNSPALTAAAFVVTYLPHLLGGAVLATLADRWPRRETLIYADLLRFALTLAILIPGMPLLGALALIFLIELVRIPFGAARLAILADVLTEHRFAAGNSVVAATQQILMVVGFAGGGVLVALIGARGGLAVDAATYLASALVLWLGVRRRPAPRGDRERAAGMWRDTVEGLAIVRTTPRMLRHIGLLMLGPSVLSTTIALSVPYADELGGGTTLAGVLMAAAPLGSAVGLMWMGQLSAQRRMAIAAPSAIGLGLAVVAAGLLDAALPVAALFCAAGLTMGYLTTMQAAIAKDTPAYARGRVFGLANTGMQLGQGGAVAVGGVLASALSLQAALVIVGAAGAVSALLLSLTGRGVGEPEETSAREAA